MEITLAQANVLTQARYDYTKVEKRAIYFIIQEVRRQFVENKDGQKDLFSDLIVKIKTEHLQNSDTVLRDVYSSLKSLRKKSIWIEDDNKVLEVGYINYFEHTKKEAHIEVQVSHKILPYLVELAEQFTTYSLTVAIALKTKYSQRFYEYCSQFKNNKYFYISIDELRTKFMIEDKYPRYKLLLDNVIAPAHKELKELYDDGQCDLYFNYSEDRYGRSVAGLKVVVVTRDDEKQKDLLKIDDHIYYIRIWLSSWFNTSKRPKNKLWVEDVVHKMILNPDDAKKLYKRLERMQKVEPETNYAAYARHIIEEDFMN